MTRRQWLCPSCSVTADGTAVAFDRVRNLAHLGRAAMPDDTADRSRQDQLRINVNEPHEIRYWTQRLGCTEQELRDAVASAGVMAEDVRVALGRG